MELTMVSHMEKNYALVLKDNKNDIAKDNNQISCQINFLHSDKLGHNLLRLVPFPAKNMPYSFSMKFKALSTLVRFQMYAFS